MQTIFLRFGLTQTDGCGRETEFLPKTRFLREMCQYLRTISVFQSRWGWLGEPIESSSIGVKKSYMTESQTDPFVEDG